MKKWLALFLFVASSAFAGSNTFPGGGGEVPCAGQTPAANQICARNGTNTAWALTSNTSGGAPTNTGYWTAAADGTLSSELSLGAITGVVISTAGTPSAYAGTSCTNQFVRSLNASAAATCAAISLVSDITGTLPLANGGTGLTTAPDDNMLIGNGTIWQLKTLPDCDLSTQKLLYDQATNTVSCGTDLNTGGTGNAHALYNGATLLPTQPNLAFDLGGDGVASDDNPNTRTLVAMPAYQRRVDLPANAFTGTITCPSAIPRIPAGSIANCTAKVTAFNGVTFTFGSFAELTGSYNMAAPNTTSGGFKVASATFGAEGSCALLSANCGLQWTNFFAGLRTLATSHNGGAKPVAKFLPTIYYNFDGTTPAVVPGAGWTLDFSATPQFAAANNNMAASAVALAGTGSVNIATDPRLLVMTGSNFCGSGTCYSGDETFKAGDILMLGGGGNWETTGVGGNQLVVATEIVDANNIRFEPPLTANITNQTITAGRARLIEFDNVSTAAPGTPLDNPAKNLIIGTARVTCDGLCKPVNPWVGYPGPLTQMSSDGYRLVPLQYVVVRHVSQNNDFIIGNQCGKNDASFTLTQGTTSSLLSSSMGDFTGQIAGCGGWVNALNQLHGDDPNTLNHGGIGSSVRQLGADFRFQPDSISYTHGRFLFAGGNCSVSKYDMTRVENAGQLAWMPSGCGQIELVGLNDENFGQCDDGPGGGAFDTAPPCDLLAARPPWIRFGKREVGAAATDPYVARINFSNVFYWIRPLTFIKVDDTDPVRLEVNGMVNDPALLFDFPGDNVTVTGNITCNVGQSPVPTACDRPANGNFEDLVVSSDSGFLWSGRRLDQMDPTAALPTSLVSDDDGHAAGTYQLSNGGPGGGTPQWTAIATGTKHIIVDDVNGSLPPQTNLSFTGVGITCTDSAPNTVCNVPGGAGVADGSTLVTGLTFPAAGLHILDTNTTHDLIITPGSDLSVDRVLTITTGDAARSLTLTGNASITGTNTGDQTTVSGNAGTVTVADAANDTTTSPLLGTSATGSLAPATDSSLTYNANTGALAATSFVGALTGNAATVTTADAGGDTTTFPMLATAATGSLAPASDAGLSYNAGIDALSVAGDHSVGGTLIVADAADGLNAFGMATNSTGAGIQPGATGHCTLGFVGTTATAVLTKYCAGGAQTSVEASAPLFSAIGPGVNNAATMTVTSGAKLVFNTTTSGTGAMSGTDTIGGSPGMAGNDITVGTTGFIFEGSSGGADASELLLTLANPTADRTQTLQDATDTFVYRDTIDTLTNKSLTSPTITAKVNMPSVTALPGSPVTGDVVVVTDDSVTGACDSAAGSSVTVCRWTGAAWAALGDGTGAGGSVTASSADTFTNKTINVEGTGNLIATVQREWFQAAGCNNATASSMFDLPVSTPAVPVCVTGTNTQKGVLEYPDTTGGFSAQTMFALPSDWTASSAIDLTLYWTTTATTGNVVWQVQSACSPVGGTGTDDPSFNTLQPITTAAPGTSPNVQTSTLGGGGLTLTGCTTGTRHLFHLRVFRDGNNGGDTIAAPARLIGAELTYRRVQ